ncbi:MAG: hypothetical protein LBC74_08040 [Planctomycetaceae bacterium]|jgi:hypothetical protein|nr:hypothetical protein [Planctomycetaceae bacterium]
MKKIIYLLFATTLFPAYQSNAQTMQDPDNAVQLSHNFDHSQGRLFFYSDNRDFCDYYLYISFIYAEGFEGMPSGTSVTVSPGRQQLMTYKVRAGASRYSYNYRYAMYRGSRSKKTNIDFAYSLPAAATTTIRAALRSLKKTLWNISANLK